MTFLPQKTALAWSGESKPPAGTPGAATPGAGGGTQVAFHPDHGDDDGDDDDDDDPRMFFKSPQNLVYHSPGVGGHRYMRILCLSKLLWV